MITRWGAAGVGADSFDAAARGSEPNAPNLFILAAANAPTDPAKNSRRFGRSLSYDCASACSRSRRHSWPMFLLVELLFD
jgi:hypothetical protein